MANEWLDLVLCELFYLFVCRLGFWPKYFEVDDFYQKFQSVMSNEYTHNDCHDSISSISNTSLNKSSQLTIPMQCNAMILQTEQYQLMNKEKKTFTL